MRTTRHQALTPARQHGAALMVMLLIMIIGGAYLLVSQLNRSSGRIEAEKKTAAALAQAKEALIGWTVGNLTTPGMLPYPDRRNDGDYDGRSDCPAAGIPTSAGLLLGKIPQIGPEAPCLGPWTALNLDVVDGAGEVLWYAVSRNLVSALGVAPVINPDIMNTPPFPWLVVRDQTGTIINNRVAFVLIAPGSPLPGQNRSGAAPTPIQFLEGISAVTNADYDGNYDGGVPACPSGMCEDFVMSEPWPSATAPTFNDRLLYVTIDELMPLIEKRVAREARVALRNSALPPPAAIGYIGNSCNAGVEGFLPLPTCECRRTVTATVDDANCDCLFDRNATTPALITYTFVGSGSYAVPGNGCLATPKSCQCTGAGSCSSTASPTRIFQCNSDGACAAHNAISVTAPIRSVVVTYSLPSSVTALPGNFSTATPRCNIGPTNPGPTLTCNNFTQMDGVVGGTVGACGPAQLLTGLPDWFLDNGWKHYMYYAVSPGNLTVGTTTLVNAVVISTGAALSIGAQPVLQTRPSSILSHYLDDIENGNGQPAFTGVGQPLTNTFNDQAVIVAP
ncbi:MAG: hypothetical protein HY273_14870 [Gammaproteobacteria bacterium]|nr:hypothetical protein [Gammaproteobacteria bacterium]